MATGSVRTISRRLRDLCEPIAGCVYFAPEAFDAYAELGTTDYAQGYFPSRGACLGHPSGEVICAAFAVFNPDIVLPAVERGWAVTDPPSMLAARERGATEALRRMLGDVPRAPIVEILDDVMRSVDGAGRPLFSGLRSLGLPDDSLGALWRVCDYVRERRGDGHVAAWVSHGCDPIEISLLTELAWGLRPRTYIFTRGWTAEQIDAAAIRLRDRGLFDAEDSLTDAGRDLRRSIEAATDAGDASVVEALGSRSDALFELLEPIQRAVLDARGYPVDPGTTMNSPAL